MSTAPDPLPKELWAHLEQASVATVTTQLFKRGFRRIFLNGLTPLIRQRRLVGEAVTLRNIPTREDLDRLEVFHNPEHPQRKAIERSGPARS